ncbi:hypothetical protein [Parachitinimonas caeni]|uniref:Uncharacterized protein n=1 Tax=Parachitinimonas caeni TaxID=3031301 RepID=A0ABT7E2X0_9NEIS|nr:hypothetical protein [Parachitinimonas caeni]MDK2126660.1 hypothetical protein [Parachitinimonas caeni]
MRLKFDQIKKVAVLSAIPSIALAQSKSSGEPAIPVGPAMPELEVSRLTGLITLPDSNSYDTFSLAVSQWKTPTKAPDEIACKITPAGNKYPAGKFIYTCELGSTINLNQYKLKSDSFTVGGWQFKESGYSIKQDVIDLSTLPSELVSDYYYGSKKREYKLDLTVSKSGFSFEDKVQAVIACAEKLLPDALQVNVTSQGRVEHVKGSAWIESTYRYVDYEFSRAVYQSGWQFAVGAPKPGTVYFRTPESAKAARYGDRYYSESILHGWYPLGSLEEVNNKYCKSW